MSIKVHYIYSACLLIETPDLKILTDPWFTQGAYDGSWFHFPEVENPLALIGDVDVIYISHIHPDHYDPEFLFKYFDKWGDKKVIIPDQRPNFLAGKMKADGIDFEILALSEKSHTGSTALEIVPHDTGSINDIDSALIVEFQDDDRRHCVINANDIIYDDEIAAALKAKAGEVDVFCCAHAGAGPYPQTYFDLDDPMLVEEAARKKERFFNRYMQFIEAIDARVNIPFAGQYLLGGKLSHLNGFRGVSDPVDVLAIDRRAVVLSDDKGYIDTQDLEPVGVRTEPYPQQQLAARISEISDCPFDYERLINPEEIHQLPIKRLLSKAAANAVKKSEVEEDYYFVFKLADSDWAVVNANRNTDKPFFTVDSVEQFPSPRSEITVDPRYLFGLLTHIYHWNNNEVGSHSQVRRVPNVFNRAAQGFLNFLAV